MKPTAILSALIMAASLGGIQAQTPDALLPIPAPQTPPSQTPPAPAPPAPTPPPPLSPALPPTPAPPQSHEHPAAAPSPGRPHPDSREANSDRPRDDRGPRRDDRDERRDDRDARSPRDERRGDDRGIQPQDERRDDRDARPRNERRGGPDFLTRKEIRKERRSHFRLEERHDERQSGPLHDERRPETGNQRDFQGEPPFDGGPRAPQSGRFRGFERGGYDSGERPMARQEFRGPRDDAGQRPRREMHPPVGPSRPEGRDSQSSDGIPPHREEGPRPVPPLMGVLDANHDGIISSQEIAGAASALSSLDKNHDGQLTSEEVRPMPPRNDARGEESHGPHGPGSREDGPRNGPSPEGRRAPLPY